MRRLLLVGLVVPLVTACGGHASSPTGDQVRRWIAVEHLPKQAVPGARVFQSAGCTVCHIYAGSGRTRLGAPELTAGGRRRLGIRVQIAHLKCPACVNPGSPMPPYRSLGPKRLRELAIFLEASKGVR
jgi:hypothetical protein